jgi:predicted DNA-binding transcriptional regulator YafY
MSQRQTTSRHNLIINKLRRQKHATFKDICEYLECESDIQGEDLTISKRTFTRDIAEIGEIYGIYIKFDFSAGNYFIEDDLSDTIANRRLEAFDIFNALRIKERQENNLFLDNRQRSGTEHLFSLLNAINNRQQITFEYHSFYQNKKFTKTAKPLGIKEFKYRWYLFAQSIHSTEVKSYGLDRISNLEISRLNFQTPTDFNLNEHLHYSFGIISPNADKPTEVILSFEPLQGQYIKSLPLHHTQQILTDNETEMRISLSIYLTYDLIMELLSYGSTLKIIQPQQLIDILKATYENALRKY